MQPGESDPTRVDKSLLLVPFYSDPKSPGHEGRVDRFAEFVANARGFTGLSVIVVDDGSGLDPEQFVEVSNRLITLPTNVGKSLAVRTGLKGVLADPDTRPGFVVLYDGDGDQSQIDIPAVHNKLVQVSNDDPSQPTLVIGDRYSELLRVEPNPDSIEYRQSILIFFGALALQLTGTEGVRDWVSGARGLTASMAQELVDRGKSSHYGLEAEQLVIAGLVGAKVATAALTISRPRDPHTLRSKWLQNFCVYDDHADALRGQGKSHVVDLVAKLVTSLNDEAPEFELDLRPIGEPTTMQFKKVEEDSYTALIPWSDRRRHFRDPESFILLRQAAAA